MRIQDGRNLADGINLLACRSKNYQGLQIDDSDVVGIAAPETMLTGDDYDTLRRMGWCQTSDGSWCFDLRCCQVDAEAYVEAERAVQAEIDCLDYMEELRRWEDHETTVEGESNGAV